MSANTNASVIFEEDGSTTYNLHARLEDIIDFTNNKLESIHVTSTAPYSSYAKLTVNSKYFKITNSETIHGESEIRIKRKPQTPKIPLPTQTQETKVEVELL